MTRRPDLHEADTLRYRITILDKWADGTLGGPLDLTSATFDAAIGVPGQPGMAGTVTPVSLAGGVVDVSFPAIGDLGASSVEAQLRVTRSGETQTVWTAAFTLRQSVMGA